MTYEENVKSYQYLNEDIKLYTKLLTDEEYKFKLDWALKTLKSLNINSEIDFIKYQIQMEQLNGIKYSDIKSYERLQNEERLKFVIEKYQERLVKPNIINFNSKRPKH